jgi:hypothetical protein
MNEVIKWQGSTVDVQARLVPRFLWNTASIDVFLDGQPILRTGGRFKFTGSHSSPFTHAGSTHTAELSWGFCGLSFSIPYQLRVDDAPVVASRVQIRNWPVALVVIIMAAAALSVIFHFIQAAQA